MLLAEGGGGDAELMLISVPQRETVPFGRVKVRSQQKRNYFSHRPKTREFTRSTIRRVQAISVETLREGRGLSPCLVSVKTVISFIHSNN